MRLNLRKRPPCLRMSGLALGACVAMVPFPAQVSAQMTTEGAPTTPATRAADNARALERCEASVVETLRKLRGNDVNDVQFAPAQRAVAPADEAEVGVKGAGRYKGRGGGNSFSYSCSFNLRSGLTSAVVLREAGGGAADREPAWQPDLSRISPEACESVVAQHLKEKHPRVAQIAMEPDTRRLQPAPGNHTLLLGQGAVQRAPGMNAVPFSYTCELDGRSGRVRGVKTSP